MSEPLKGVKVIDMSHVIAGPFASHYLSQLGAEVIKIEKPGVGDVMRASKKTTESDSIAFTAFNAGKKSLAIDIRTEEGANIIRSLAKESNIFIENFRPGVVKKYGLDYESIKKINPQIIYCSISGYGQEGSWSSRGGYDQVIQALTGMMMMSGPEDSSEPIKIGFPVIDIAVGMLGAIAISSALYQQKTENIGQHIETSLIQASLMLMYPYITDYLTNKEVHKRIGNRGYSGSPGSDTFKCKDGWLATAANTPSQFKKMMSLLDLDEICSDPNAIDVKAFNAINGGFVKAKDSTLIKQKIEKALSGKSAYEIEEALNNVGVPAAKVSTLSEFLERALNGNCINLPISDFVSATSSVKTPGLGFTFNNNNKKISKGAPSLGENTEEVLKKLGLTQQQIQGLIERDLLKK